MLNLNFDVDSISVSVEDSSLISKIIWEKTNPKTKTGNLTVVFTGGEEYEYCKFPFDKVEPFIQAKSVGGFFHKEIRDKYETYKLEGED